MSRRFSQQLIILGLLSFVNDLAGEMVKPLLPAFITSMGLGAGFLGLLEGIANSSSYLVMLVSGTLADHFSKNRFFTSLGYYISSISRPFLAIPIPAVTLISRLFDRLGKGLRTPSRDQLITQFSDQVSWGRAFGFQRAMDHTGGIIGTALATLLLIKFKLSFSTLVLIFSLPVFLFVVLLTPKISPGKKQVIQAPLQLKWKGLPTPLKTYAIIILISALGTPSELFLILKMQEQGLAASYSPLAWFVMACFTLIAAYTGGPLGDRFGRRRIISIGWAIFVVNFMILAYNNELIFTWILVAIFGFQNGIVEASERAFCSEVSHPQFRATAFGWYYFAYGLGSLPASLVFGLTWKYFGSSSAFILSALISSLALILMILFKKRFILKHL